MVSNTNSVFSDESLASLPTPLSISFRAYRDENIHQGPQFALIKLWKACEAVELLLRFLACIAIGELYTHGKLTGDVVGRLREKIRQPTLGKWRAMLTDDLMPLISSVDTIFPELPRIAKEILPEFLDGRKKARDIMSSFSALRNRLAHGAGLNNIAAESMLVEWEREDSEDHPSIHQFFERFEWLCELSLYSRRPDGQVVLLRGLTPMRSPYDIASQFDSNKDDVIICRHELSKAIRVWPLMRYGIPQIGSQETPETFNANPEKDTVVEMYAQRLKIDGFQYTPIGSRLAHWSTSNASAASAFFKMFPKQEVPSDSFHNDAIASFREEIVNDAAQLIGRVLELEKIRKFLEDLPTPVLWLSGTAGIGKSILVAKIAEELIARTADHPNGDLRTIPYRFKGGDERCSRHYFFMITSQTVDGRTEKNDPRAYDIDSLRRALITMKPTLKCIFVVDGIDEIDELDPGFVSEVCLKLAREFRENRNIIWLFSGRPSSSLASESLSLDKKFSDATVTKMSLEAMEKKDVRAMLLEQIGMARNKLIEADETPERIELFCIPSSPQLTLELDHGTVPKEIFAEFERIKEKIGAKSQAYPDPRGNLWNIDDNDDGRMFFVKKSSEHLHISSATVKSGFVDYVTERSKGLPIYVKLVVDDIKSGILKVLDGTEPLPDGLNSYYQKLLQRLTIGTLPTLLTPMLCLIASAREPLTKDQMAARLYSPDHPFLEKDNDDLPESRSENDWIEQTISHLSSMLKSGLSGKGELGYTLYHHTLRQHLETDPAVKQTFDIERKWLVKTPCAQIPLEKAGPFAGYVAREGVTHLLEHNEIAKAVNLLDHLKSRNDIENYLPTRNYLSVITRQVCSKLENWVQELSSKQLSSHDLKSRRNVAKKISPKALANAISNIYETGLYSAAIRILIEFHYEKWWANKDNIKDRFLSSDDMVARHSVGEALAEVFLTSNVHIRKKLHVEIMSMACNGNIDEREAAGYALQSIFLSKPDLVDDEIISRWASSNTNIERMILGELLVSFSFGGDNNFGDRIKTDDFWDPIWENNAIDIDDFETHCSIFSFKEPELGGRANKRLEKCLREYVTTQSLIDYLLSEPYIKSNIPIRGLLESYNHLAKDDSPVKIATPALQEALNGGRAIRRIAKDVIKILFSHPLWVVTEVGGSILHKTVEEDSQHLSLIEELLSDPDSYWRIRYGSVDAAFDVGHLDNYQLFRRAIRENYDHENSRVRGICIDNFFAWIRLSEKKDRDSIISEFDSVIKHWVAKARDCWELEYIYLLFHFLNCEQPEFDVKNWLSKSPSISPYLGTLENRFYELGREEFLVQIDRIRNDRIRKGEDTHPRRPRTSVRTA